MGECVNDGFINRQPIVWSSTSARWISAAVVILLAIFSLLAHHCMRSAFASFCALNCFESDLNLFISTKRGIYGICMLFWLYSFIHSRAFIFIVQR